MTPQIVMLLIGVLIGSCLTIIGYGLLVLARARYEQPLVEQRRKAWGRTEQIRDRAARIGSTRYEP